MRADVDAVVVGAGPNGLAAAITLARAGCSVVVFESATRIGGGCRTAELTLPGFRHDVCAGVHPLAAGSPFLSGLPLAAHGLELVHSPLPLAHPLPDGRVAVLHRSLAATAVGLGADGRAYADMLAPLVRDAHAILTQALGPLRIPRHPLPMLRFARLALRSAQRLARRFRSDSPRALLAGLSAHSNIPLEQPLTAGIGLVLGLLGHVAGWPIARGGSQAIVDAMCAYLRALGGEIRTGTTVTALAELPRARAVLLDVTPRQLVALAGDALPARYRARLERYRYGFGTFKIDWALDAPVPWRAEECLRSATLHIGGTFEEIAAGEREVARGGHPQHPFVLLSQPSVFDGARAPAGKHTLWGYCHVPNGSTMDMTARVEAQIERFAPGFRERVLARNVLRSAELETYNANYVGGDIAGGSGDLRQFLFRPVAQRDPYATPLPGVYLCSSSTPPGPGVHGMCGYYAARSALADVLR